MKLIHTNGIRDYDRHTNYKVAQSDINFGLDVRDLVAEHRFANQTAHN